MVRHPVRPNRPFAAVLGPEQTLWNINCTLYVGKGAVLVQLGVGFRPASGAIVIHFAVSGPIERPMCKQCRTSATLARVTPGDASFETHSFVCPSCNHVFIKRVAAHPISAWKG